MGMDTTFPTLEGSRTIHGFHRHLRSIHRSNETAFNNIVGDEIKNQEILIQNGSDLRLKTAVFDVDVCVVFFHF